MIQIGRIACRVVIVSALGLAIQNFASANDDNEKLFLKACGSCHTAKKLPLDRTQLTKEKWIEAIERMISYGAELPKEKLPELLGHIIRKREQVSGADDVKR